jgi:diguanylate cyclase (GGDEF)-like protein
LRPLRPGLDLRLPPALRGATLPGIAMIAAIWVSIGFCQHLDRLSYAALGSGLTLLTILVMALSFRQRKKLDEAREALRISERLALEKTHELQVTLDHMARHDALTDLSNRVVLRERMMQALANPQCRGEGFALLCLDLDHFRDVNDTLGHPAGDDLLCEVADRLSGCVREGDTVARLGGDEFAILSPETKQHREAGSLAERVLAVIIAPYELGGEEMAVGASIGIALAPNDGSDADELFKRAELALYRAKSEGRNTFRYFEREMDAHLQSRRTLELALRNAVLNGEFELHYQPLVNTRTGKIMSFEALLRWRRPQHGLITSAEFIPFAEEIGLIVPIGEWALQQACTDAAKWPQEIKVAVNLSAVQFKKSNLTSVVVNALAFSGLSPLRVELEITETVLLGESAENLSTLRQLRSLGIAVVLDDFGTGYSSLSYLVAFPFDKIKIDKSFVTQLFTRPNCIPIVRAITALGNSLGMIVTGEGVETRAQLDELVKAGCDEAQGIFFSAPRPAAQVAETIAAQSNRRVA